MSKSAIIRRSREAKDWLLNACFPLWANKGVSEHNIFAEALEFNHDIVGMETTRVRVQARQTYMFSEAYRMGWQPELSKQLVEMGVTTLREACYTNKGLPGVLLKSDGSGLTDQTINLYDVAFVIYALSHAGITGDDLKPIISDTLSALGATLKDARNGGFVEHDPIAADIRLQNPHMHLFEALLSLQQHQAADSAALESAEAIASDILGLFLNRFTAGPGGLVGERFAKDWSEREGADASNVEPGHQFEWVWLLCKYANSQSHPVPPEAARLYQFACSTLDADGRACQLVTRSASRVDDSRRTWPQTEALKAHLAMFEATGDDAYLEHASRSFDCLFDEYLTLDGGWMDHFDASGAPIATNMPASTGYHVTLALSELIRVAQTVTHD